MKRMLLVLTLAVTIVFPSQLRARPDAAMMAIEPGGGSGGATHEAQGHAPETDQARNHPAAQASKAPVGAVSQTAKEAFQSAKDDHLRALAELDKAREKAAKEKAAAAEASRRAREAAVEARKADAKAAKAKDPQTKATAAQAARDGQAKAAEAASRAKEADAKAKQAISEASAARSNALQAAQKRGLASNAASGGSNRKSNFDRQIHQITPGYADATPQQRADVDRRVSDQIKAKQKALEDAKKGGEVP